MNERASDRTNEHYQMASLIMEKLIHAGPCTWDALVAKLSPCTWNGVFAVMDALSREGTITIQPEARFQYRVSLTSHHPMGQPVNGHDSDENFWRGPGLTQEMRTRYQDIMREAVDKTG